MKTLYLFIYNEIDTIVCVKVFFKDKNKDQIIIRKRE